MSSFDITSNDNANDKTRLVYAEAFANLNSHQKTAASVLTLNNAASHVPDSSPNKSNKRPALFQSVLEGIQGLVPASKRSKKVEKATVKKRGPKAKVKPSMVIDSVKERQAGGFSRIQKKETLFGDYDLNGNEIIKTDSELPGIASTNNTNPSFESDDAAHLVTVNNSTGAEIKPLKQPARPAAKLFHADNLSLSISEVGELRENLFFFYFMCSQICSLVVRHDDREGEISSTIEWSSNPMFLHLGVDEHTIGYEEAKGLVECGDVLDQSRWKSRSKRPLGAKGLETDALNSVESEVEHNVSAEEEDLLLRDLPAQTNKARNNAAAAKQKAPKAKAKPMKKTVNREEESKDDVIEDPERVQAALLSELPQMNRPSMPILLAHMLGGKKLSGGKTTHGILKGTKNNCGEEWTRRQYQTHLELWVRSGVLMEVPLKTKRGDYIGIACCPTNSN